MIYDTAIVTCTIIVRHIAVTIDASIVAVDVSIAENSLLENIAVVHFFVDDERMKLVVKMDEKINVEINFGRLSH